MEPSPASTAEALVVGGVAMRATRWRSWHAIAVGACLGVIAFMIARGFYGLEASPAGALRQLLAMICGGGLLGAVVAFIAGVIGRRGDQSR